MNVSYRFSEVNRAVPVPMRRLMQTLVSVLSEMAETVQSLHSVVPAAGKSMADTAGLCRYPAVLDVSGEGRSLVTFLYLERAYRKAVERVWSGH